MGFVFLLRASSNERLQRRMLLEEFEILRPAIEPEDVPGAFYDEIGENTCIDQMKVDNQIALVLMNGQSMWANQ